MLCVLWHFAIFGTVWRIEGVVLRRCRQRICGGVSGWVICNEFHCSVSDLDIYSGHLACFVEHDDTSQQAPNLAPAVLE